MSQAAEAWASPLGAVDAADRSGGDTVWLHVSGYQFPEADDPPQRYSWHVIAGEAACPGADGGSSTPALTCDESPRVSAWLRAVADWFDDSTRGAVVPTPKPLTFLEPNLTFRMAGRQPSCRGCSVATPARRAG